MVPALILDPHVQQVMNPPEKKNASGFKRQLLPTLCDVFIVRHNKNTPQEKRGIFYLAKSVAMH